MSENKSKNKYNKKLSYLQHDELDGIMANKLEKALKFSVYLLIFFFVTTLFSGGREYYPSEIISIDAGLTVSLLLFLLVIKPMIYSGKIKAFYRRSYKTMGPFIRTYAFFSMGAIMRLIVTQSIFAFNAFGGDYTKAETMRKIFGLYDKNITPIIIVASVALLYFAYFQDKYISISEFSDKAICLIREDGISRASAIATVKQLKDMEHGVNEYDEVYYDNNNKPFKKKTEDDIGDILMKEIEIFKQQNS